MRKRSIARLVALLLAITTILSLAVCMANAATVHPALAANSAQADDNTYHHAAADGSNSPTYGQTAKGKDGRVLKDNGKAQSDFYFYDKASELSTFGLLGRALSGGLVFLTYKLASFCEKTLFINAYNTLNFLGTRHAGWYAMYGGRSGFRKLMIALLTLGLVSYGFYILAHSDELSGHGKELAKQILAVVCLVIGLPTLLGFGNALIQAEIRGFNGDAAKPTTKNNVSIVDDTLHRYTIDWLFLYNAGSLKADGNVYDGQEVNSKGQYRMNVGKAADNTFYPCDIRTVANGPLTQYDETITNSSLAEFNKQQETANQSGENSDDDPSTTPKNTDDGTDENFMYKLNTDDLSKTIFGKTKDIPPKNVMDTDDSFNIFKALFNANGPWFRYSYCTGPLVGTYLILSAVFIFVAIKILRFIFELAFTGVIAPLFAATDFITNGQRTKEIVRNIISIYVALMMMPLLIGFFEMGFYWIQGWGGYSHGSLFKLVAEGVLAWTVIDGPDIMQRLIGQDIGLKDGLTASKWAAAKGLGNISKMNHKIAKAAVNGISAIAGKGGDATAALAEGVRNSNENGSNTNNLKASEEVLGDGNKQDGEDGKDGKAEANATAEDGKDGESKEEKEEANQDNLTAADKISADDKQDELDEKANPNNLTDKTAEADKNEVKKKDGTPAVTKESAKGKNGTKTGEQANVANLNADKKTGTPPATKQKKNGASAKADTSNKKPGTSSAPTAGKKKQASIGNGANKTNLNSRNDSSIPMNDIMPKDEKVAEGVTAGALADEALKKDEAIPDETSAKAVEEAPMDRSEAPVEEATNATNLESPESGITDGEVPNEDTSTVLNETTTDTSDSAPNETATDDTSDSAPDSSSANVSTDSTASNSGARKASAPRYQTARQQHRSRLVTQQSTALFGSRSEPNSGVVNQLMANASSGQAIESSDRYQTNKRGIGHGFGKEANEDGAYAATMLGGDTEVARKAAQASYAARHSAKKQHLSESQIAEAGRTAAIASVQESGYSGAESGYMAITPSVGDHEAFTVADVSSMAQAVGASQAITDEAAGAGDLAYASAMSTTQDPIQAHQAAIKAESAVFESHLGEVPAKGYHAIAQSYERASTFKQAGTADIGYDNAYMTKQQTPWRDAYRQNKQKAIAMKKANPQMYKHASVRKAARAETRRQVKSGEVVTRAQKVIGNPVKHAGHVVAQFASGNVVTNKVKRAGVQVSRTFDNVADKFAEQVDYHSRRKY